MCESVGACMSELVTGCVSERMRVSHDVLPTCACRPEPHILLFRRKIGTDPVTGQYVPALAKAAKAQYMQEFEGTTLA